MRRLAILALGLAAVAVMVSTAGPLVWAQPVASIALPPPRGPLDLYNGCNNVALSFPDATDSQTVAAAVTPTGVLRAMWRHNAAQNRFEGFSPAAPQASDLLKVNLWDAVWLCVGAAPTVVSPPPPPPAEPAPLLTPAPTVAPTPTLGPISIEYSPTRPPGSFTGTPFPNAELFFFIVSGFDLDAVRTQLVVTLSGPDGPVPNDPSLWQWVQGAPNAIAVFMFPGLPKGNYRITITLPDGRTASCC